MSRLLFIIFLIPILSFSQDKSDYRVYSQLIEKQIEDWDSDWDEFSQLVITDRLTCFSLDYDFKSFVEQALSDDTLTSYFIVNNKDEIFKLLGDDEFRDLLTELTNDSISNTKLRASGFTLPIEIEIVKHNEIEKRFNAKNRKRFRYDRAWKRYYRDYPKTPGYFEISKILESKNYGLIYFIQRASPLTGNGRLMIYEKNSDSWDFVDDIDLWFN